MDNSEDIHFDSLMGLLDDNEFFESETRPSELTNPSNENISANDAKPGSSIVPSEKGPKNRIALSEVDLFSSEFVDNPNSASDPTKGKVEPSAKKRLKILKDGFRTNLLDPQKVENPKPEEVYETHVYNKKDSIIFNFGEMDSSDEENDEENKEDLTESGKSIKKELKETLHCSPFKNKGKAVATWKSAIKSNNTSNVTKPDNLFIVDSYSGIRIINPLVSFSTLKERMKERRMIKMSFIENCIKGGDIEGDWVTMGVIIGKVPPKISKNGKTYSIWKMSDLHDPEKSVSVFLFRNAHSDHWKTTVGTVLGILNPSIMPGKDNRGEISIAVDNPGKLMMMGKSKDLGFCKSKRKDFTPCNMPVNTFQCEYCTYHVKKEYKKFSAKRSELQASYNGREPSLKNKLLKGTNIFYGGQSFTALGKKPTNNTNKSKDKLTLSNLGLKRKAADALDQIEKERGVKKLAEIFGPGIVPVAESNSEFINTQLAIPTVGSRNLLQHLMKEKSSKEGPVKEISSKELLKMRNSQMTARGMLQKQKNDSLILKNLMPQLGRGLQAGQEVNLDFSSSKVSRNSQDFAKMRAIQKIKEKGQLKRKDPNSVKVSLESTDKVKAVLEKSFEEKKEVVKKESSFVQSKLGSIDFNSEKVKAILNRKSSHAYEVEMAEMEKEASYFNALEKKEQMEEKMASTTEMVCDVVSCKKCKYTAHTAAERCKKEQHPLKCHKALKRFFECKDCKRRTFGFSKFPTTACRNCRGSNFERTSMLKARTGPKLDSEILNIRGDESKFLNSLSTEKF